MANGNWKQDIRMRLTEARSEIRIAREAASLLEATGELSERDKLDLENAEKRILKLESALEQIGG